MNAARRLPFVAPKLGLKSPPPRYMPTFKHIFLGAQRNVLKAYLASLKSKDEE
jgi:hypothetical protein